jgi:flagellin-like protein
MKNNIQLKKIQLKKICSRYGSKNFRRRAVAPVIATLLLVAIAVVGGSIIFVFSQGFFSSAQISGSPQIESIKILGYDASDGTTLQFHDGIIGNATTGGSANGLLSTEYITVYLKNDSVNKVTMNEIRLAGAVYAYHDFTAAPLPNFGGTLLVQEYALVPAATDGTNTPTIDSSAPEMEPGQQLSMVLALKDDVKSGRDLQYKLTTTSGAVFVGTVNSGQQSG